MTFLTMSKTIRNVVNENEGTIVMRVINSVSLKPKFESMSNMMITTYRASSRILHQMTNSTISHIMVQICKNSISETKRGMVLLIRIYRNVISPIQN